MKLAAKTHISDGCVFENTHFKKMLSECKLNLPNDEKLFVRTTAVPYVFLGDDAPPLYRDWLKRYQETQEKGPKERIFNYRLSREVRKCVQNIISPIRVFEEK